MSTIIISPDDYILNENGAYEWTPARATSAWDRAFAEFQEALLLTPRVILVIGIPGSGKSTWINKAKGGFSGVTVFDATLTSRMARRPLIEMARERASKVEAVVFDVPLITAYRRNATRAPERRVPYETVIRMLKQLESEPPTLSEGFWRISAASEETSV